MTTLQLDQRIGRASKAAAHLRADLLAIRIERKIAENEEFLEGDWPERPPRNPAIYGDFMKILRDATQR